MHIYMACLLHYYTNHNHNHKHVNVNVKLDPLGHRYTTGHM